MRARTFLTSDSVRIAYDDFGDPDGRPLVLCHGIAVNGSQFFADAEWFSARGFRVLVPNLRGHGRSGVPAVMSGDAFSLARLARDMVEMLDDAGVDKVAWVGNSLGGMVALAMLDARRFSRLATFGTPYSIPLPNWGARTTVLLGYRFWGQPLFARLAALAVSSYPAAQRFIARMVRDSRAEVTAWVARGIVPYDFIARAARETIPLMLIRCGEDRYVNATLGGAIRTLRRRPNFRLVELTEGGHCANLEVPEHFRRIVLGFVES